MSKPDKLRGFIAERLAAAAREILAAVERTVSSYEAEASGCRREMEQQRRQLEALLPRVELRREGPSRILCSRCYYYYYYYYDVTSVIILQTRSLRVHVKKTK